MVIIDGVVDLTAGAPRPDEAHAAQQAQLVRYRRLADADEGRDVANAELARRERVEDADAGRIAQGAERVREPLDGSRRQQPGPPGFRAERVEVGGVAVRRRCGLEVTGHLNI